MQYLCTLCKKPFERKNAKPAKHKFCSRPCHDLWRKINAHETKCLNCGKITKNPKYCSRSCAATHTNKTQPKRKKVKHYCTTCGVFLKTRRKFCKEHNPLNKDWSKITYGEVAGNAKYQKNSAIRNLARTTYDNSGKNKACKICRYETHIHVCHIKEISSFPEDTPVATINDISNLVALCPNHHWELDNGLLNLEPLTGIEPA